MSSVSGTLIDGDEDQRIQPCSPCGESRVTEEVHLNGAAAGTSTSLVIVLASLRSMGRDCGVM